MNLINRLNSLESFGLIRLADLRNELEYFFRHALVQDAAYDSLLKQDRKELHLAVGEALERIYPEQLDKIASTLAYHFEKAANPERAIHYLTKAARNAARAFGNQEALALSQRGLELVKTLPVTSERQRQELTFLLTLAPVLMAVKGWSVPEVELTYNRARELCEELGDDHSLFVVLWGLFLFYMIRADLHTAHPLAEQLLSLAQRTQEATLVVQAHNALGIILMDLGRLVPALEQFEAGIALYDPQQRGSYEFQYALDPGIACRCFAARILWPLGYPDRAVRRIEEALSLAQDLSDPQARSFALVLSAIVHQFRREPGRTREDAEKVIKLATELGLVQDQVWGMLMRGWAEAEQGLLEEGIAHMRQSLAAYRAMGSEIARALFVCLLVEPLGKAGRIEEGLEVTAEALAVVHRTGERYYEAEPHRLKGELLLMKAGRTNRRSAIDREADSALSLTTEAEACFRQALDIARSQEAKSWELRAALSLGRLWQDQGRKKEARETLSDIYRWFKEGLDTPDLMEAKALLAQLSEDLPQTQRDGRELTS